MVPRFCDASFASYGHFTCLISCLWGVSQRYNPKRIPSFRKVSQRCYWPTSFSLHVCGFPENETILHVCCVFVPTAYRRDISCWNISFFLPLFPYTKPSPRSFKPIQRLDLFQAVSYDSRGVFGGKNIIKKILKTGKRKTGVCIYIYDAVGTNSVKLPSNVPTASYIYIQTLVKKNYKKTGKK